MHDGQKERRFVDLVQRNPNNTRILARLPELDLPECYLVAGCLFQTVWNCLSDQSPDAHISDYDIFYYDKGDLSWEAENEAIRHAERLFADLGVQVQLRNQARVHVWYESRFGITCNELAGTRDGIDHFLNQSSCFGIRRDQVDLAVYAPFGFDDLFAMIVRPNPRRELPSVYYEKANRWSIAWPSLRVLHWPAAQQPNAAYGEG